MPHPRDQTKAGSRPARAFGRPLPFLQILTAFCLLLFVVVASAASKKGSSSSSEAEKVAREYLTAFVHGNLHAAAALTHPSTLEQFKARFTQEWENAKATGQEATFLGTFGLKDAAKISSMDPVDLYVILLAGTQRSSPEFAAAMQRATVAAKSSKALDAEKVQVTLGVTMPKSAAGKRTETEETKLVLEKVEGQWKVFGNAQ
jgi:hypothetical protein